MKDPRNLYYEKRARRLLEKLRQRHFDAWYCEDRASALEQALSLIPKGATVGWGGALTASRSV